jgi:hypothetical protein
VAAEAVVTEPVAAVAVEVEEADAAAEADAGDKRKKL